MKNIDSLTIADAKDLLKHLNIYRDMKKKLGVRWVSLFKRNLSGQSSFLVEHFSTVSEDLAFANAQAIYKKTFGAEPKREEIEFRQLDSIGWGIKVYMDDNMVDMSYSKIKKALKA